MIVEMIDSAWRSLAIGSAAWIALKTLRFEDPRTRKMIWTAVLVSACLMPLWRTARIGAVRWQAPALLSHTIGKNLPSVVEGPRGPARLGLLPSDHEKQPPLSPIRYIVFLYWTVTATLLARLLVGLLAALRVWRRAKNAELSKGLPPSVRVSKTLEIPVTIASGVVLPASFEDWDSSKLNAVLTHELSHVREGDFFWQLVAKLYACFFWFSPLGWFLCKELTILAEMVSDECALCVCNDRFHYAELLLEFAARAHGRLPGAAIARPNQLRTRIERILDQRGQYVVDLRRRLALAAVLAPVLFMAATLSINVKAATNDSVATITASKAQDGSYVIVSGDSVSMSGSSQDAERAKGLKNRMRGDYIWFRSNGKEYVIDDPKLVGEARKLFHPQEELGRMQASFGAKQAKLGEVQAELGKLQAGVSVDAPDVDKKLAEVEKSIKSLNQKTKQQDVTEVQAKLAELQASLATAQALAGDKQAALGDRQAKLAEEQARLGEQQAQLGDQQAKLAEEASRKMKSILDNAVRSGVARPAP